MLSLLRDFPTEYRLVMKPLLLLIMLLSTFAVNAKCVDDTLSTEQNITNCIALAEQGDAYAQYALANFYNSGQGVKQDAKKAVEWYIKSAQQNNDLAQYSLGTMYEFGEGGLEQSLEEANKWYRLSADNGNYFALNKLGLIVPKKIEQSEKPALEPRNISKDVKPPKSNRNIIERFFDWAFGN